RSARASPAPCWSPEASPASRSSVVARVIGSGRAGARGSAVRGLGRRARGPARGRRPGLLDGAPDPLLDAHDQLQRGAPLLARDGRRRLAERGRPEALELAAERLDPVPHDRDALHDPGEIELLEVGERGAAAEALASGEPGQLAL